MSKQEEPKIKYPEEGRTRAEKRKEEEAIKEEKIEEGTSKKEIKEQEAEIEAEDKRKIKEVRKEIKDELTPEEREIIPEKVEKKREKRVINVEPVNREPFCEWEEGEQERALRNALKTKGYAMYELAAHPDLREIFKEGESRKEVQEKAIKKWNELGLEKLDPQLEDSYSYEVGGALIDCGKGLRGVRLDVEDHKGKLFDLEDLSLVSKPENYLPVFKEKLERKINVINVSSEYERGRKETIANAQKGAKLHIESFGKAALDSEKDLLTAIEAFDYADSLKNPEIDAEIKNQIEELEKSEKPEDKELLEKINKKLNEISEREEEEKKKKAEEKLEESSQKEEDKEKIKEEGAVIPEKEKEKKEGLFRGFFGKK